VKPAAPASQSSDAHQTLPVPLVMLDPIHVTTDSSPQTENLSFSNMNQTGVFRVIYRICLLSGVYLHSL